MILEIYSILIYLCPRNIIGFLNVNFCSSIYISRFFRVMGIIPQRKITTGNYCREIVILFTNCCIFTCVLNVKTIFTINALCVGPTVILLGMS